MSSKCFLTDSISSIQHAESQILFIEERFIKDGEKTISNIRHAWYSGHIAESLAITSSASSSSDSSPSSWIATTYMPKIDSALPEVCIVVPTYFAGKVLRDVLASICMLDYPKDKIDVFVVAVPNDEEAYFHVKETEDLYRLKINFLTVNAANVDIQRNYGIRLSKFEHVLLVDDDVVLDKNVLKRAVRIALSNENIAAVVYPVMSDNPSLIEKLHHGRYMGATPNTYTVMPCSLFKRSILLKVGLYREDMGPPLTIHEDWELGSRLRKHGFKIIVDGSVVQKHLNSLRRSFSKTDFNNSTSIDIMTRTRRGVALLWSYASSYMQCNSRTFFGVMKSSPLLQQMEYAIYFMMPLIGLGLCFFNLLYALIYVLFLIVGVDIHSYVNGYYRLFGLIKRLTYPIVLTTVRVVRTYLSLLGLLRETIVETS